MMSPEHAMYTENHEWIRDDGGVYVVGITEFAVEQLGEITFVELPEVGERLKQDCEVATIESISAASEVYAPVSGNVVEINEFLGECPEVINKSPYDEGWLFKIGGVFVEELDKLMDSKRYDAFMRAL